MFIYKLLTKKLTCVYLKKNDFAYLIRIKKKIKSVLNENTRIYDF